MRRRRFTIQLTPLLDLLLIVIFAQYMAVQQTSQAGLREAAAQVAETVEDARDAQAAAELARDAALRRRAELTDELAKKADTIRELQDEKSRLMAELREAEAGEAAVRLQMERDQRVVGTMLGEMFALERAELEPLIENLAAAEAEELRRRLEQVRGKNPEAMIHYLRTEAELRKWCDVWEVHIADNDTLRFTCNGDVVADDVVVADAYDVQDRVRELVQGQGEPKGLVLFMHTYGNASFGTRKVVERGLEAARDELSSLYNREKRFHVRNLGYLENAP